MKNPFQYGKIAEAENFIDRDEDRAFLKQSLFSGTNVILMSPRRWGKSSLVKRAMSELCGEQTNVRVCHIDAFPVTSSAEFYRIFVQTVLRATASHMQAVMDSVGRFLRTISPKVSFSPAPMTEFTLSFDLSDNEREVAEILNLPEQIAEERGLQIVVCIDEFQKLAKLPDYEKLEAAMRSVWQHHRCTSYCLYGSQRHMMENIFNSPEKPFYRFGQIYPLRKIESGNWNQYIRNRFAATGKRIEAEQADRITTVAECHSWYVQQLASAVWNFTDENCDEEAIEKACAWCVDVNSETYRQICDSLTDAQIGLLRAVADGESQLSASAVIRRYRLGSSAAVIKNKRQLVMSDIITATKPSCEFVDPIFRLWFQRNYCH